MHMIANAIEENGEGNGLRGDYIPGSSRLHRLHFLTEYCRYRRAPTYVINCKVVRLCSALNPIGNIRYRSVRIRCVKGVRAQVAWLCGEDEVRSVSISGTYAWYVNYTELG